MKYLFLFLLLLIPAGYADPFCSIDDSSSCSVDKGELTLDPVETAAFISKAQDKVCIVYFYSDTCTHCESVKPFLDSMEQKYGDDMLLTRYEVSDPENIKLYNQLCSLRGYDGKKIPLVGINDRILVGETQIREELESEIEEGIAADEKICPLGGNACHLEDGDTPDGSTDNLIPGVKELDWKSVMPIVVLAGITDGINPCAFVILVFVMVFLQRISGNKRRLLRVSLTYIITIFLTNTLLGILYFTLSIRLGFPDLIRYTVIAIAIVAGLINIKDFFWYGKGVSLGIPKATKRYLQRLINKASVSASFVLGVSVAVLEAPCSVPIYLAVIEVLKSEGSTLAHVFPYILVYNIMFILPLVVLSFIVYKGFSAHVIEKRSITAKRWMKLAIGLLLILLAIAMLLGWI